MRCIVALGNPTKVYGHTRHNIGRRAVAYYLQSLGDNGNIWQAVTQFMYGSPAQAINIPKFFGEAYRVTVNDQKSIVISDLGTYMNTSGQALRQILSFLKIAPENLILVHDDIDLPFGNMRLSQNSSAGGHNGVRSIIEAFGTQNFIRLRIGIEARDNKTQPPTEKYVLQRFTQQEEEHMVAIGKKATDLLTILNQEGLEVAKQKAD